MLPKVVLHKRNGHRDLPDHPPVSLGEVIRTIHSEPRQSSSPTLALLGFARIVGSETRSALADQVAGRVDGIKPALAHALARTQAALGRGELQDIATALESYREQLDAATRMIRRLMKSSLRAGAERRGAGRRLVDLNGLVAEALYELVPKLEARVTVTSRFHPELPRVLADPRRLLRALVGLLRRTAHVASALGGVLTVETSPSDSAVRGERLVRITMEAAGGDVVERPVSPAADPAADAEAEASLAGEGLGPIARIAAEHGGAVRAVAGSGRGVRFVLELPAA